MINHFFYTFLTLASLASILNSCQKENEDSGSVKSTGKSSISIKFDKFDNYEYSFDIRQERFEMQNCLSALRFNPNAKKEEQIPLDTSIRAALDRPQQQFNKLNAFTFDGNCLDNKSYNNGFVNIAQLHEVKLCRKPNDGREWKGHDNIICDTAPKNSEVLLGITYIEWTRLVKDNKTFTYSLDIKVADKNNGNLVQTVAPCITANTIQSNREIPFTGRCYNKIYDSDKITEVRVCGHYDWIDTKEPNNVKCSNYFPYTHMKNMNLGVLK